MSTGAFAVKICGGLKFKNTVKIEYYKQLGTFHFCSLQPGFVVTG